MGWGSPGGVSTGSGSPEHEKAQRRSYQGPGLPGEPRRVNGCVFAVFVVILLVAVLIGAGLILQFIGGVG